MRTTPAVVYVAEEGGILESDVGASDVHVNGVMVIVGAAGPDREDDEARVRRMREVSVPATRLMGAMSVVLYFDREAQKHYFVRGAAGLWRMFALGVAIGDEVEFSVHADPCVPQSCSLCRIADCSVRSHSFERTIPWTVKNVLVDGKHSLAREDL